jgi:Na+-driven multidrug efflux pump
MTRLRGKQAVMLTARMGAVWAAALGVVFWFAPEALIGVFDVKDPHVVTYSVELLHFLTFSGIFLAMGLALTGGLQGAGYTKAPMIIAIMTQIVILLGVCQIFVFFGALTPNRVWMAILISHLSRLIFTYAVFRTDGWAHKRIEVAP